MIPMPRATKRCTKCGEEKPLAQFYPAKRGRLGLTAHCKTCISKAAAVRMKKAYADPQKRARIQKRATDWNRANRTRRRTIIRKQKYGVDDAWLFVRQGGKCPVCGEPITPDDTHVDHDHATGKVRGLVHPKCNWGLTFIDNHRDRWLEIATYLGLGNERRVDGK